MSCSKGRKSCNLQKFLKISNTGSVSRSTTAEVFLDAKKISKTTQPPNLITDDAADKVNASFYNAGLFLPAA